MIINLLFQQPASLRHNSTNFTVWNPYGYIYPHGHAYSSPYITNYLGYSYNYNYNYNYHHPSAYSYSAPPPGGQYIIPNALFIKYCSKWSYVYSGPISQIYITTPVSEKLTSDPTNREQLIAPSNPNASTHISSTCSPNH